MKSAFYLSDEPDFFQRAVHAFSTIGSRRSGPGARNPSLRVFVECRAEPWFIELSAWLTTQLVGRPWVLDRTLWDADRIDSDGLVGDAKVLVDEGAVCWRRWDLSRRSTVRAGRFLRPRSRGGHLVLRSVAKCG